MARPLVFLAMLGVLLSGGFLVFGGNDQPPPVAGRVVDGEPAEPDRSSGLLSSAVPTEEGAAEEPSGPTDRPAATGRSIVGITLHGKVADAGGRAVDRGSLVLFNGRGDLRVARIERGRTEYEIAGVTPGRWTASVIADGYADRSADLELDGSSASVRHDVVLEQGAIDVRLVTPEGQSLLDVLRESLPGRTIEISVIATRGHPGARVTPFSAGDDTFLAGRYRKARFRDPDRPIDGTIRLAGLPPVHVSAVFRGSVLTTVQVPCATREVALVVPLARVRAELTSLHARFVDFDTATPVRGAAAVLIDADRLARSKGEFTDGDGSLVLDEQPPGRWTLEVAARGYARYRRSVLLAPGRAADLGTVRLSRCVTVAGTVVDAAGKPVRAQLSCHPADRTAPLEADPRSRIASRPDGSFRISNAGRGAHVLIARGAGYAPLARRVDTADGDVDGLEIVLERGVPVTIEHRIQESRRYRFELIDDEGWTVHSHEVLAFAWPWRLRLAQGSYTLRVHDRDSLYLTQLIVVGTQPVTQSVPVE